MAFVTHKKYNIRDCTGWFIVGFTTLSIIHIPRSTATCTFNLTWQQKTPEDVNFICRLFSISHGNCHCPVR